jgi:hypothetical protein
MTFFKVFALKSMIFLLPYVVLMRLLSILRDIITIKFKNVFARLRAIFWILSNFKLIMKKRNEVQKLREASDNYILKIFSEKYLFRKRFVV